MFHYFWVEVIVVSGDNGVIRGSNVILPTIGVGDCAGVAYEKSHYNAYLAIRKFSTSALFPDESTVSYTITSEM